METGLRIKTNLAGFSLIEVLTVIVIFSILLTGTYFYIQTNQKPYETKNNNTETLQEFIHKETRDLQLTNKFKKKFIKKDLLNKIKLSHDELSDCDTEAKEIHFNRYGQWSPFQLNCHDINYFISNNGLVSNQ